MPVFSSDGLALYFYALTAHFGAWIQQANTRRRTWAVDPHLLYAQVTPRLRRVQASKSIDANTSWRFATRYP